MHSNGVCMTVGYNSNFVKFGCFDYNDTIFLKPPFTIHLVSVNAQKSSTWITHTIHGLNWDSGIYDYSFLYCFVLSLKIRFPNIHVYGKGNEKCWFLRNFFTWAIDLDQFKCPKASEFPQNCSRSFLDHLAFFSRDHCSREKSKLFYLWLSQCQQNACLQLPKDRKTRKTFS